MFKKILFSITIAFISFSAIAQLKDIKIEEERKANRIFLYALNENLVDLDVSIEVEGTGIRTRAGKPRLTRVPATSKVNITSIIVERDKTPVYTYKLTVNEELSKRVIKAEATPIKIDFEKPVTIYTTKACTSCDSLVAQLDASPYRYALHNLEEKPEMRAQIKAALPSLDAVTSAVVSIKGVLYTKIETLNQLLEKINAE
ncbi:glutaredoxin domain-containing protein [Jejudonia soesokkakensis]|uniref:Glutaredoxin domain-containing protein n=1 Tax=Jejudonia soesokkakensis TaxID=1323432 RepID=A0ABW2MV34_9FLAO